MGSSSKARFHQIRFKSIETHPATSLRWHHNERDGVWNARCLHCFLICLFRHRSKKTSKLRVTRLCSGKSPVTGEFPAQKASNAEMYPFDDRLHVLLTLLYYQIALCRASNYKSVCYALWNTWNIARYLRGEFSNSIERRELYLRPRVRSQPAIVPEHMGI